MKESYVLYKQAVERAEKAETELVSLKTKFAELQHQAADAISALKCGTAGLKPEAAIADALETLSTQQPQTAQQFAAQIQNDLILVTQSLRLVRDELRKMLNRWHTMGGPHATRDGDILAGVIVSLDSMLRK